jgi:osmoprotectant transport system substrate-binding protein
MRTLGKVRWMAVLALMLAIVVPVLAGCGSNGGSSKVTVVVGSKKDSDSQLEGYMYALLLQQAGFNVQTKIPLGDTNATFTALKSNQIDVYPEFTGTALFLLKLNTTHDAQQDYNAVKSAYESQYHITWLDAAFQLNDSYGICTSQANATKYSLQSIADLARPASNGKPLASTLTISAQADATDPFIQPLEQAYGFTFGNIRHEDEQVSYTSVQSGLAQLNICYTTDPEIQKDNFVLLSDTKNVFPFYNPAPIVRDAVLNANPSIATTLNQLASHLTTAKIDALITQLSGESTPDPSGVAQSFLKSEGLLH